MSNNCKHKVRHRKEIDARNAIQSYRGRVVSTLSPLEVYWCNRHKCYHVGHRLTDQQRKNKWEIMNWWKTPKT